MFSAFVNSLKIPELRSRIFYTLALLFVARVGAAIPLPGIDPHPLQAFFAQQSGGTGGAIIGLYNMFTGGALLKGAVCSLGIMPYISASIVFQLMTAIVPSLSRLQQEGDVGRQKITQYTRYATVLICLVQGTLTILALENPAKLFPGYDIATYGNIVIIGRTGFLVTSVIYLTAGTMLMMWLGEQITQRGIGNGVSLLITVGILATLPGAAAQTYQFFFGPIGTNSGHGLPLAAAMLLLFFGVTMVIILIVQGQRKIPVQYAKRVVGNKVMGGQSSFLPPEGQLFRRHAGHFRQRHPALPPADHVAAGRGVQPALPERILAELAAGSLDLLHGQRPADPLFQLFLGGRHVQADPDRR